MNTEEKAEFKAVYSTLKKKKKNILLYVQKTKQQNSLQMELVPWEGETDGKGASGIPPLPVLSYSCSRMAC